MSLVRRATGDPWFAALMVAFVVIHGTTNLVMPMASYRTLQLGVPPEALGLLATAFSIPPLVVALRVGRIVDRRGGVAFIAGGLVLMALAALGLAAAPSFPLILVAYAGLGLGHLTAAVAAQGMVARGSDERDYDRRFSTLSLASSFGQLVGPAIAGIIAGQGSPDATVRALLVGAGLAAAGAPIALLLRRPERDGRQKTSPAAPPPSVRALIRTPGLAWAIVVSTTVLSATDIIGTYLPAFGNERGWAASLVGALLALRAASSMTVRLVLGRLAVRYGRGPLLAGAMTVSASAFVALPFVHPVPLVVLLLAAIGAGLGIGQPMTMAWVASLAAPGARATAMSVRMVGNRVGQVALPAAAGAMAAVAGVGGVLIATGMMVGAGLVGVARGLARRSAGRDGPPPGRDGRPAELETTAES